MDTAESDAHTNADTCTNGDARANGVRKSPSWQVVSYEALPDWLKDNKFLLHNHRLPTASFRACARSIFKLHTETMNIWTHLIGSLAFVTLMIFWYVDFFPVGHDSFRFHASKLPWQEQLAHLFFLGSAILCMAFSAIFHTVSNHSVGVAKVFSRLDYSGIAILITGSNIMCYYYAFYCNESARTLYTMLILICGSLCVLVSMWNKFSQPGYHNVRGVVFLSLGLYGIVPVSHMFRTYDYAVLQQSLGLSSIIGMAVSYIVGALIYMMRVPERFFPGKCDIVLHSHTIFHILVFVGCLLTYDSMHTMALTRYLKNLRGLTSHCNSIIIASEAPALHTEL